MKWGSLIFASVFTLTSLTALADDDKLSKGRGGESQGRGRRDQTPPPQRNNDNRNQGGGGRRDQSPPPRRESPPPQRQTPPPQRQVPPPQRNDDNRNQGSPRRDQIPPPRRQDDDNDRRNQGGGGRRDQVPPPRRDSNPPRQDNGTGSRNDTRPPIGRPGYNNNGQLGNLGNVGSQGSRPRGEVRDGTGLLGRNRRTDRTTYGTVNNQLTSADRRGTTRVRIDRAPINPGTGSLEWMVRRQERVQLNRGWRHGYYSYHHNWRDDYFCYPFYVFTPSYNNCVISPWYYYPHLPAYLGYSRITVINLGTWAWRGDRYNWRRPSWNDNSYNNYADLDYAIDDLVNAFERADTRALGRLIPRYGRVNIALEGRYTYSVSTDDLYDMLLDAIDSTRTIRYEIVDVRRWRNEAQVVAQHRYEDPWGYETSVYHTYRLEQERNGYVIRDFGTSTYRSGW